MREQKKSQIWSDPMKFLTLKARLYPWQKQVRNFHQLFYTSTTTQWLSEGSTRSSICWELNFHGSGLNVRSIEVDLKDGEIRHWNVIAIGDNGILQDIPLATTWKSESFCGSKIIALGATTFGFEKATLMRAKLAEAGNGTKLRITVKLQGKPMP